MKMAGTRSGTREIGHRRERRRGRTYPAFVRKLSARELARRDEEEERSTMACQGLMRLHPKSDPAVSQLAGSGDGGPVYPLKQSRVPFPFSLPT